MPNILLNAIVSGRNQEPYVQILVDGKMVQFTPDEARSVALQLMTAAEAATGDAFLVHFMGGVAKGNERMLGSLLSSFRDYRSNLRAKGDPLQWGEPADWPGGQPPDGKS
jgi:hypothetical protein